MPKRIDSLENGRIREQGEDSRERAVMASRKVCSQPSRASVGTDTGADEVGYSVMKVPHVRYLHSCVTEDVFSLFILEDSFF